MMSVYLLHFDSKYMHTQHYVGFSAHLPKRLERHFQRKCDVKLLAAVHAAGIGFSVARV